MTWSRDLRVIEFGATRLPFRNRHFWHRFQAWRISFHPRTRQTVQCRLVPIIQWQNSFAAIPCHPLASKVAACPLLLAGEHVTHGGTPEIQRKVPACLSLFLHVRARACARACFVGIGLTARFSSTSVIPPKDWWFGDLNPSNRVNGRTPPKLPWSLRVQVLLHLSHVPFRRFRASPAFAREAAAPHFRSSCRASPSSGQSGAPGELVAAR